MSAINSLPTVQQTRGHYPFSGQPRQHSESLSVVEPRESWRGSGPYPSSCSLHEMVPSRTIYHRSEEHPCFRAFITRRTQEGLDWHESDSRCETDGAAVAIPTGSPDGIGVTDRKTARATCRNGGTSAHRAERGSHAGGG